MHSHSSSSFESLLWSWPETIDIVWQAVSFNSAFPKSRESGCPPNTTASCRKTSERHLCVMLTSPRLPQLPGAQGRSQSGFYTQTMAAGYGIFTHFSYQHGGLVSPAHEKLSSSISRSGSARAIGGALEGRPRHSRIFLIASGEWIAAKILMRPPQRSHSKTSKLKNSFHQFSPRVIPSVASAWLLRTLGMIKPTARVMNGIGGFGVERNDEWSPASRGRKDTVISHEVKHGRRH